MRSSLKNKEETRRLCVKASRCVLQDGVLFKRGYTIPLPQYIANNEALYVLMESRGHCRNRVSGLFLSQKIHKQGYY